MSQAKQQGRSASAKGPYTFSKKVDMSMDKAKKRLREMRDDKPLSHSKRRAGSTFVQKLYRDEDELNDLKVLAGGEDNFDSDVEDKDETSGLAALRKRDAKLAQKQQKGVSAQSKVMQTTKVGKLKLEKGSVALFAVNEVYAGQYAIVNHTRNVKGFINLKDKNWELKPGQLVIASVLSVGTATYLADSSGHKNRKLQLSLDPQLVNRGLTSETVTTSMILQGVIESKEAKGYIVDIGLKDKAKAFVKFDKSAQKNDELVEGTLVHVIVQSKTSKLIRCAILTSFGGANVENNEDDNTERIQQVKTDLAQVTPHTLKPGFVVSAKVQKLFTNGVEVSFLGGMTGTIFADHLSKSNVTKYKMGEKLQAIVISQDIASKATALSALPQLLKLEAAKSPCTLGQLYTDVRVEKKVFGNSYLVKLDNTPLLGLLHKSNIPRQEDLAEADDQAEEETKDLSSDDAKKKRQAKKQAKKRKEAGQVVNSDKDDLLDIGQTLPEVRVKEFNYFDGMPILSMLPAVVQSGKALDYKTLTVGEFHTAEIESVNEAQKSVTLKLGDFVRGTLPLEHMADHPLKVIPPKFTQVGKEIKVRIFQVDGRHVELTKKDSLMKDNVEVYNALSDLRPGMKLQGVVVGRTEHGFVVKSFQGLKGLLKHDDVKEYGAKKLKTSELKPGSALKAYVQFVKKGSGIALTLSKKKARKANEGAVGDAENQAETLAGKYLPTEDEVEELRQTYASLLTTSRKSAAQVGQTATYRVCESRATYHVLKSNSTKKPQIAILPRCLATSFGITRPFGQKDFGLEALTIAIMQVGDATVAILCAKPELIELKEEFTYQADSGSPCFVALVEGVSSRHGITLRFSNGVTKLVAMRDISQTEHITRDYSIGQLVRVANNKTSGRLTLKKSLVEQVDTKAAKRDQAALLNAFDQITAPVLTSSHLKIGQKIQAKVQLVKDYGLILEIIDESSQGMTGFIVNEQKLKSDKVYKIGETVLDCIVLDIDFEKQIVDLSERLVNQQLEDSKELASQKKQAKKNQQQQSFVKAVVELNKERYLVISLKSNRSKIGVCILHGLAAGTSAAAYEAYGIGDEIDVKVTESSSGEDEGRFLLTMARQKAAAAQTTSNTGGMQQNTFDEGQRVLGTLKSIKGMCAFIQVGSQGRVPIIGRLHRVETSTKKNEFEQLKPGDKIEAKILRKTEEKGRMLIELTRRSEHMKTDTGLNKELVKLLSLDTISNGQKVEGLITDVVSSDIATKVSCPVQVQVSPLVRGQLLFSDIIDPKAILEQTIPSIGEYINASFKAGQRIPLTYANGRFTNGDKAQRSAYERGDLAVVRFVKLIRGYGVTVQLDQKTFGVIELCELTDSVTQNVVLEAQKKGIFIARVIDHDKKGRLQLSARESILNDQVWRLVQPEGTSGKFMAQDQRRQENANMRNKVLKFGAALTFKQGDLTLGYVTNISKAGCFIQVAHNVTMRAGLNELSDDQGYDFLSQMPIGRVVLARITKASEGNTRFDCSLRKSLIVYGVHQVTKGDLKTKARISCLILAITADGVAFGQVKGSYHKLKIKDIPDGTSPGQLCLVELTKITSDKMSGAFVEFDEENVNEDIAAKERHFAQIYASVQEEAQHDIMAAKRAASLKPQANSDGATATAEEPDIEQLVQNKRKQTILEEQIRDLQQLDDHAMSSDDAAENNDSDAEEMKRLQQIEQQENEYESSEMDAEDDEEEEDEIEEEDSDEDDGEEGESEGSKDSKMEIDSDDSSGEESKKPQQTTKSGKKALRAQLELEKTIRAKEAQMRSAEGAVPTSVNDFERMLVADYDQSYLWIQYMAFMLENLDAEAARRVAERAVKQVSMTAEDEKLNLWIAFMNLESKFGTTEQLQDVVKRALDVNDRKKVYLQLINIYKTTDKFDLVEDIYKKLCKKYFESLEIWSGYIEFLFEMRSQDGDFTEPKTILQRSLQALPKANHVNIISKFGMLEFRFGSPEHGRTMFEGIVSNYPKRMDIWSIYMDMEIKHGGEGKANQAQARHLFERCLSLDEISRKPKKMKLVFRKYMEYENSLGNEKRLGELRQRVEQYIEQTFKAEEEDQAEDTKMEAVKEAESEAEEDGASEDEEEDDNSEEDEEAEDESGEEMDSDE